MSIDRFIIAMDDISSTRTLTGSIDYLSNLRAFSPYDDFETIGTMNLAAVLLAFPRPGVVLYLNP